MGMANCEFVSGAGGGGGGGRNVESDSGVKGWQTAEFYYGVPHWKFDSGVGEDGWHTAEFDPGMEETDTEEFDSGDAYNL